MSKKQFRDSEAKTGYYGYSSELQNISSKNRNKKAKGSSSKLQHSAIIGVVLAFIQLALSITFVGLIIYKKLAFISTPILTGIIAVLIILLAVVLGMQKGSLNVKRGGKVISVIVILLLAVLIYLIAPINKMSGKKVSSEPFVVFASADDSFGSMDSTTLGRSDTNILAVVNPKTYTVVMISTPRDYYVEVKAEDVAANSFDKLTHCGLYGNGKAYKDSKELTSSDWQWAYEVNWHPGYNVLMNTLQNLYGFETPKGGYHYVRLNFTGFAKLIDALGGITIDVDQAFSTSTYASYGNKDNGQRKKYTYTKGEMKMDGDTALTFARERHSFGNGDFQRNKNQVKVLKSISDKLLSGTTLLRYTGVMDAIQKSFTTDMDLSSLVSLQTQLATKGDYNGWNILSFSVTGTPSRNLLTFTGSNKSIVDQDVNSVTRAKNLIKMTLDGKDSNTIKKQIKTYNKEQGNN